MDMQVRRCAVFLVGLVVLTGCVDEPKAAAVAPAPTSAPPAAPKEDAGSVSGRTVDDEQRPLAGVEVAVLQLNLATQSDSLGAFTFNDLPPGDYSLVAQRLGFDSKGIRVSVRAGEVTEATITLTPLAVASEPHSYTNHRTAYIQVGNAWLSFALFTANATGLHNMMCPTCIVTVHFPPKPVDVLTEGYWQCSPCYPPLVNDDIWFLVNVNVTSSSEGTVVINSYLSNWEQFRWTPLQESHAAKAKGSWFRFRVEGGGGSIQSTGATGVSYNQRVELFNSFGYVEDLPENFTAMPPKA